MRVLGIETSCDESSVAIVDDGQHVRALATVSQVALHVATGGVVPEVAAREHVGALPAVVAKALADAQTDWSSIDRIAVTRGPGLVGSLLVGVSFARGLAQATGIPLVGVHHVLGHVRANWLERDAAELPLPAITLTVSGGHNDLLLLGAEGTITALGSSLDDAAGEAFDKVARLLGLPYPGGPAIQQAAQTGNPAAYTFPRAWLPGTDDFSFSGLKSAVWRLLGNHVPTSEQVPDLAASFQEAVVDVLATKAVNACVRLDIHALHLAGGVAANSALRARVTALAAPHALTVSWPVKMVYCTDNAAMIAAAGAVIATVDDWRSFDALPTYPLHNSFSAAHA